MKKLLSLLLVLFLALPALAEEAPAVYVSITDEAGVLALAHVPVSLTDADGDGALTLNDALISAHAAHHPDGAAAYLAEESQFGMSMVMLWGCGHGVFGYCINDAAAMSPLDPILPGDHVVAYAYTDLAGWSDLYAFFQAREMTIEVGGAAELMLHANGFDDSWAPVVLPVSGAEVTIDGVRTSIFTDAHGHALLPMVEAGTYLISAVSDSQVLVAPVCILTVK